MVNSKPWTFVNIFLLASAPLTAYPQQPVSKDYPSRAIRVVLPFVTGGTQDFIANMLGQKMAPVIGQNLYLDNRPGAGGAIGTNVVAKSPPDGYTMLVTSSSHAILPGVSKSLPYDPVKDFEPVTLAARGVGLVLVVHPSVPVRSVRELITLAKAHPGKLNYGSGGIGSVLHFGAESFNLAAGTQITHVPYKGVGQAIIDLLAGRIDMAAVSARGTVGHLKAGKLRALGLTATLRWSELPGVPTMEEAGLKGYTYAAWYGFWFPAGTPVEYVTRIRTEVVRALEDPETKRRFAEQGLIGVGSTPEEFGKTIIAEIEYHRKLVARMGLTQQ